MVGTLQGSSVVVIGGSSGIGLATARQAIEAGAQVTIAGRDQGRLDDALATLGGGARGVTVDVADEHAVSALFAGLDHVDHVATLAGTHVDGRLAELEPDAIAGPLANRLWGPINVFRHAPPKMGPGGSITICTGAGVGRPRPGGAVVTAAAGGSEFLARAMALELAPIRVNVIRPGIVDTPLLERLAGGRSEEVLAAMAKRVPLGRVAEPDEIADAILFLMRNPYVTGETLAVDGGISIA